jgi:hypothetical protein
VFRCSKNLMIYWRSVFTLAAYPAIAADTVNLAPLFLRIVEQHPKRAQVLDCKEKKLFQKLEQVWNKTDNVGTTLALPHEVNTSKTLRSGLTVRSDTLCNVDKVISKGSRLTKWLDATLSAKRRPHRYGTHQVQTKLPLAVLTLSRAPTMSTFSIQPDPTPLLYRNTPLDGTLESL